MMLGAPSRSLSAALGSRRMAPFSASLPPPSRSQTISESQSDLGSHRTEDGKPPASLLHRRHRLLSVRVRDRRIRHRSSGRSDTASPLIRPRRITSVRRSAIYAAETGLSEGLWDGESLHWTCKLPPSPPTARAVSISARCLFPPTAAVIRPQTGESQQLLRLFVCMSTCVSPACGGSCIRGVAAGGCAGCWCQPPRSPGPTPIQVSSLLLLLLRLCRTRAWHRATSHHEPRGPPTLGAVQLPPPPHPHQKGDLRVLEVAVWVT